jgi:YHS domain-containing protein
VTLTVVGMNAEDSPERLGRVLELCPGVAAAEIAPARGTVTIAYDPRTADVAMLLRLTVMVGTRGRGRVTSVSVVACGGVTWNGTPEGAVARDPICDMRFPPARAVAQASFDGRTYYFCSKRCRALFDQHPTWYTRAVSDATP